MWNGKDGMLERPATITLGNTQLSSRKLTSNILHVNSNIIWGHHNKVRLLSISSACFPQHSRGGPWKSADKVRTVKATDNTSQFTDLFVLNISKRNKHNKHLHGFGKLMNNEYICVVVKRSSFGHSDSHTVEHAHQLR